MGRNSQLKRGGAASPAAYLRRRVNRLVAQEVAQGRCARYQTRAATGCD